MRVLFLFLFFHLHQTLSLPFSDYNALISIRSAITDDATPPVLSSWNASTSHCSWFSVTCDAHRHVVALNLTGLNLSGTLSADIAHLSFLSNLSLVDNKFSGPIPLALSSLSALRLLKLSNNGFNQTFPPELSRLHSLEVLDLYNNNMTNTLPLAVAQMLNVSDSPKCLNLRIEPVVVGRASTHSGKPFHDNMIPVSHSPFVYNACTSFAYNIILLQAMQNIINSEVQTLECSQLPCTSLTGLL
ncbi:LRR receptor-like serine/threonine-protein kinase EFR [Vigna unguiculata]|uniref:LRR receptor-like serine/threonine-protein kinase EFR n=1 Tax=Vigna unguiculata TaxID=3917 RepID=A0A4D6M2Y0_VIGUN|nr:LRR receptor-like serine/threonine-protein kinase EFR [Vigna unguiculata]